MPPLRLDLPHTVFAITNPNLEEISLYPWVKSPKFIQILVGLGKRITFTAPFTTRLLPTVGIHKRQPNTDSLETTLDRELRDKDCKATQQASPVFHGAPWSQIKPVMNDTLW